MGIKVTSKSVKILHIMQYILWDQIGIAEIGIFIKET
jgi:hypothetical protein